MVKRDEIVNLGGLWLEGHGLSEKSATPGLSSRVRRAAPSLQMQSVESVVASYGLAKTATLTVPLGGGAALRPQRRQPLASSSSSSAAPL